MNVLYPVCTLSYFDEVHNIIVSGLFLVSESFHLEFSFIGSLDFFEALHIFSKKKPKDQVNYVKHSIEKQDWYNWTPSEKTQVYREY